MPMKRHSALLLMLGLCACEAPPRTDASDEPAREAPATAPAPASAPPAGWSLSRDAEGISVELERDGVSVARFACLHSGRVFQAQGFSLDPIGSEERLTVGAGDEAHALVADPGAPMTGVLGSGAIPPALLAAIEVGGPLSLSYGAQTIGPLESLGATDRAAFVAGCRAVLAG